MLRSGPKKGSVDIFIYIYTQCSHIDIEAHLVVQLAFLFGRVSTTSARDGLNMDFLSGLVSFSATAGLDGAYHARKQASSPDNSSPSLHKHKSTG